MYTPKINKVKVIILIDVGTKNMLQELAIFCPIKEPPLTAGIIKTSILKFTKKSLSNFKVKAFLIAARDIAMTRNRVL